MSVPYYCQWESPELALDIIEERIRPANDPQWANSGAASIEEYDTWASQVCGMACLKMLLAAKTGKVYPTLELLRRGLPYGTYDERPDGSIFGLIYAPFVQYVKNEFDLASEIKVGLTTQDIPAIMKENSFFIASVHCSIRWPERTPPKKGGHLILVTKATEDEITFHNPSGHKPSTRENAKLPPDTFEKFFAGRGIVVR